MYLRSPYKIILVLVLWGNTCIGQSFKNAAIKNIGLEEELTSVNVRKMCDDKNGFMWFATQDGINKYNGSTFVSFTKHADNGYKKLLGTDCSGCIKDLSGKYLYILSNYEGLNIIDINTNTITAQFPTKLLLGNSNIVWLKMMILKDSLLIIATNDQLIFFNTLQQKVTKKITIQHSISENVEEIVSVDDDNVAVFLSGGSMNYYSYKFNKCVRKITLKGLQNGCVVKQTILKNNFLWLATTTGLFVFDRKNLNQINTTQILPGISTSYINSFTNSILFFNNYLLINNVENSILYDFTTATANKLNSNENVENLNYLKGITCANYSNKKLWLGGPMGVTVVETERSCFSVVHKGEDEKANSLNHVYSILPTANNNVFVSSPDGFYNCSIPTNSIDQIVKNNTVLGFTEIDPKIFLISTSNGIYINKEKKVVKADSYFSELKSIQNELFISVKKLNDQKIIMVSELQNGIFCWDRLKKQITTINTKTIPAISETLINDIKILNEDEILVIEESNIEKINFKKKSIQNLFNRSNLGVNNAGVFMDICKQGSNYYIGTYGLGLVKLDSNFKFQKLISSQEGINNIGIYKVFSFNDSLIAITTNNGLSIYNTKSEKVRNYFAEDGLHSNAFEETSGFQKGDTIYAGGIKGFTIFDTKKYKTNTTIPLLYFDNIIINTSSKTIDTTNLFIKKLSIPNNVTQTKISFIGLNYQNPNRVNYWYRIIETGTKWIDLKNQNFIQLIGIAPGKYHLEVKAANEDGVECAPISMELHFLPKWYQTLLFKIIVGLLVAALLFILYSFRIRQLKKVLAVRQKISQNLHDDIGSTLSAINMYTQVAKLQPQSNEFINSIEENTQDALGKLDDIIWSTNPKNDKIKNLVERMDGFARPLLQAKNIQFNFIHSNIINEQKIGEAIRQNLFVIFKEAINNVVKYAECTNCNVVLEEKNKNICCSILDDGKGFDVTKPTERNGILNMQLRAKEMKGSFTIESNLLKGTKVLVQLPI